jgi:hypothetical protein
MKIRTINIIEIFLFLVFALVYFLQNKNITHFGWTLLFLYFLLGILYFPFGFYTLKSPKFGTLYSVLFGFLFSGALTGVFYASMTVGLSVFLLLILIVWYVMAATIPLILKYIFNRSWLPVIIGLDKGITIRCLIYFIYMIYALANYNFRA